PKKTNIGPSDVHNQESSFIFYNWLEDTGTRDPFTKTIDNSLIPSAYYKVSKEDADEMGLY
ncbi:TPA: cytosolic protein, partial [Bacillus cereus]|nr:cytosolic protein [Bacillus cereus]